MQIHFIARIGLQPSETANQVLVSMQSVLRLCGHVPQAALPLRLLGARTFAVSPGDAFTTQLQAKTERELEELLERSNRPVSAAAAETARQEAEVCRPDESFIFKISGPFSDAW